MHTLIQHARQQQYRPVLKYSNKETILKRTVPKSMLKDNKRLCKMQKQNHK